MRQLSQSRSSGDSATWPLTYFGANPLYSRLGASNLLAASVAGHIELQREDATQNAEMWGLYADWSDAHA